MTEKQFREIEKIMCIVKEAFAHNATEINLEEDYAEIDGNGVDNMAMEIAEAIVGVKK